MMSLRLQNVNFFAHYHTYIHTYIHTPEEAATEVCTLSTALEFVNAVAKLHKN